MILLRLNLDPTLGLTQPHCRGDSARVSAGLSAAAGNSVCFSATALWWFPPGLMEFYATQAQIRTLEGMLCRSVCGPVLAGTLPRRRQPACWPLPPLRSSPAGLPRGRGLEPACRREAGALEGSTCSLPVPQETCHGLALPASKSTVKKMPSVLQSFTAGRFPRRFALPRHCRPQARPGAAPAGRRRAPLALTDAAPHGSQAHGAPPTQLGGCCEGALFTSHFRTVCSFPPCCVAPRGAAHSYCDGGSEQSGTAWGVVTPTRHSVFETVKQYELWEVLSSPLKQRTNETKR